MPAVAFACSCLKRISEGALPYDIPRCRDWEWDRDRFYVYDDARHPGWYVLINSRLGRSVHVEFFGM